MAANLSNPELEARILKDPNDIASYLVYSDWLSERGDPRGELIALQAKLHELRGPLPSLAIKKESTAFVGTIELDRDPTRKLSEPPRANEGRALSSSSRKEELEIEEGALLLAHRKVWLGESLAEMEDPKKDLAFAWRLGFIDAMRFGPPLEAYESTELDFEEVWTELLQIPHLAFLREVVIGSKSDDDYPASWDSVIATMVAKGMPEGVERLTFDCGGYWDISSTQLGDIDPLYPKLRALRSLKIRMGSIDFGATIDLPSLESLEIVTGGLTNSDLAAISSSSWPNLERLSICIGESGNDYGCDVTFESLQPILDVEGSKLARVRHLGLCNSSLADQIASELARSAILPQLKSLDLSKGTFGDEGARALLENAKAFQHLDRIDLTHHFVSEELQKQLTTTFGDKIDLSDPEQPDEYDDQSYRYCAISE